MACNAQGGLADPTFESSPDYRDFVAGVAGAVPEIGSALAGLTTLIWKDNHVQIMFNDLVAYVNALVPEMINQAKLQAMQQNLIGLMNDLTDYISTSGLTEKGEKLESLLSELNLLEPQFFDPTLPQQTELLAHFIAFGTIKLTALREQWVYAKQYFNTDVDDLTHLTTLQQNINQYTTAAAKIKSSAMSWRLGQIVFSTHESFTPSRGGGKTDRWFNVVDNYCGTTGPDLRHQDESKAVSAQQAIVQPLFQKSLDFLMQPAASWPKLVPSVSGFKVTNRTPFPLLLSQNWVASSRGASDFDIPDTVAPGAQYAILTSPPSGALAPGANFGMLAPQGCRVWMGALVQAPTTSSCFGDANKVVYDPTSHNVALYDCVLGTNGSALNLIQTITV